MTKYFASFPTGEDISRIASGDVRAFRVWVSSAGAAASKAREEAHTPVPTEPVAADDEAEGFQYSSDEVIQAPLPGRPAVYYVSVTHPNIYKGVTEPNQPSQFSWHIAQETSE